MSWIDVAQVEALPSFVIPALVAAAVALVFEVLFKPSLAVRSDRRVARDRGRREAAEALWTVASRAEVVALMGPTPAGSGLQILQGELDRLEQEIELARSTLVRSWWSTPKEIPELATAGLARPRAVVAGLGPKLTSMDTTLPNLTLSGPIGVVEEDLRRAEAELAIAAAFLAAAPHRLLRRGLLLVKARELTSENRAAAERSAKAPDANEQAGRASTHPSP